MAPTRAQPCRLALRPTGLPRLWKHHMSALRRTLGLNPSPSSEVRTRWQQNREFMK